MKKGNRIHRPGIVGPNGAPVRQQAAPAAQVNVFAHEHNVYLDLGVETRILGMRPSDAAQMARHLIHSVEVALEGERLDLTKTGRPNAYRCDQDHLTYTREIHPGIAPFVIDCDLCDSPAFSEGYPAELNFDDITIDIEFFSPTGDELAAIIENPHVRPNTLIAWVRAGGLIGRDTSTKEIIMFM